MMIALILASGNGTRFGMPKSEAAYDGVSFLERITATLQEAGVMHIHTAKGYETADMLATLKQAVVELGESAESCSGYLIFPVDFPFVKVETITALLGMHYKFPMAVIRPAFYGFSGHPIIIPADMDLNADDHGKGLKGLILYSGRVIKDIQVNDQAIHLNINYKKDLEKWKPKN